MGKHNFRTLAFKAEQKNTSGSENIVGNVFLSIFLLIIIISFSFLIMSIIKGPDTCMFRDV